MAYLDERIPEPELMDDPEQARAYAEADFAEAHEAVVDQFGAHLDGVERGTVLDLGCGSGDVTLRFLSRFPGLRCVGIDGSAAMLEIAHAAAAQAGLSDRLELRRLTLPASLITDGPFAAVVSNSLLHHLHTPAHLWDTIARYLAPGAPFVVCDLMRPAGTDAAAELVSLHAAQAGEILRRDFYNSLCAAFRPEEVELQAEAAGLGEFEVEPFSDRHLAAWGRR